MDNTPKKKSKAKKAASPNGIKCSICGFQEMDCVGHLGIMEHLLTFPNGRVVEADK